MTTPLLVPIEVQAMVLNNPAVNLVRAQMNYGSLAECQSPSPGPFQEDEVNYATNLDNHGVYLRWSLPRALRHAEQQPDGTHDFPYVPNRWLVVRVFRPAASVGTVTVPQVTAWMVQSDQLQSPQGSTYVDPTNASTLTQILVGAMVPVTAAAPWQEPAATPYFLRAVAESNPAFAAYQPFNQNIFSIHDALYTNQVGAGVASYFVMGWYSAASADILGVLQSGTWPLTCAQALEALGWSASAQPGGSSTAIYHGAAFGVPWQPESTPPPSPKDGAQPQVAVGNTSVDAVVAFAQAAFSAPGVTLPDGDTPQQAADLLEAFQYNVLPLLAQAGGQAQLEQQIRAHWFGSAAAGTTWTIVDAPQPPAAAPLPPPSATEQAAETAWLTALNAAQSQFDLTRRTLMSLQRRLFELWWKQQAVNPILVETGSYPWNTTPEQFAAALDPTDANGFIAQARTALAQLAALSSQIPTAAPPTTTLEQAIEAYAAKQHLPATRRLKAVGAPRFWAASDPVIVLSGTAHMMAIDPDTTLACRWPAEVVTALDVTTGSGGPAFTIAASQLAAWQPAVNLTNLPAPAAALYAEFFLLDPANAALVAAGAGQTLTPAQTAALAQSMAAPAAAAGTLPSVLAAYPWQQPWQPLYLDWNLTWYPIPYAGSTGTPNWAFNGTDYDLVPGVATPGAISLVGRSVLTPKPSFEFKARIDQYITDYPGTDAARALASLETTVGNWDFLSQTLSGLTTQLASWSPVPTLRPSSAALPGGSSVADLIGEQALMPPNPQLAQPGRKIPPSTFEGLRGGQFSFARLAIVDVFGQTLEIVTSQTATQSTVVTGNGVQVTTPIEPIDVAGLAQLPPRLLQPARLDFQFTATGGDNPIQGWILPNHLDGSLLAYGPDGTLYGELSPATNADGQPEVVWWPAPDTPFPSLAALPAAQPQFGGFLAGLQAAGAAALDDLLRSVDETLWTVDPLGDRSDTFLSVLVGRPLAVVSASIAFELQADAWTDPAWPYTFAEPPPSPRFLSYAFPVALGDPASRADGLIGYFADGHYNRFNAVSVPAPGPGDPPPSGYTVAIGPGNWLPLSFAARGPGPAHALTLVMDPRAAVHARCGILPQKDVTLPPAWVDDALAAMKATFRTGPLLAELRPVLPTGSTTPNTLVTPSPAERRGTWQWRQLQTDGNWPATALAPADGNAVFPDTAPVLRDGVMQFSGGLGA